MNSHRLHKIWRHIELKCKMSISYCFPCVFLSMLPPTSLVEISNSTLDSPVLLLGEKTWAIEDVGLTSSGSLRFVRITNSNVQLCWTAALNPLPPNSTRHNFYLLLLLIPNVIWDEKAVDQKITSLCAFALNPYTTNCY